MRKGRRGRGSGIRVRLGGAGRARSASAGELMGLLAPSEVRLWTAYAALGLEAAASSRRLVRVPTGSPAARVVAGSPEDHSRAAETGFWPRGKGWSRPCHWPRGTEAASGAPGEAALSATAAADSGPGQRGGAAAPAGRSASLHPPPSGVGRASPSRSEGQEEPWRSGREPQAGRSHPHRGRGWARLPWPCRSGTWALTQPRNSHSGWPRRVAPGPPRCLPRAPRWLSSSP